MSGNAKSFKAQNLRWLCAIAVLDAVVLGVGSFASASLTELPSVRPYWLLILPAAILLLTSLIPSEAKAKLVFWRWRHVLPGHRAFSRFASTDPRINLERLRTTLGGLPSRPRDQNKAWYQLYLQVKDDPAVVDSHKLFLLFRDAASMSLLLCICIAAVGWATPFAETAWSAVAVFGVQYILCMVAARNNGNRFVTNVLAVHSHREG